MNYTCEFINRTKVPVKSRQAIDPNAKDVMEIARTSQSRDWEILVGPLTSKTLTLGPGKSLVLEGNEFWHFAPYTKVELTGERDPESGLFVPRVICSRRSDYKEPDWALINKLPLVLINDDAGSLNACPSYRCGDWICSAMYGVELIVPVDYDAYVSRFTGMVYQQVQQGRVLDPTRPEGYRVVYEGGEFVGALRDAKQMAEIKAHRHAMRAEAEGL